MKKLAVAVAFVVFGAVSASAQQLHQFVGPSDNTFTGGQGQFGFHQACQVTFDGEAVWCTSRMIIDGGPAFGVVLASNVQLWVNPIAVGGLLFIGGAGVDLRTVTDTFLLENPGGLVNILSCSRWTDNSDGSTGLTLENDAANGSFANRSCNVPRAAACCALGEGGGGGPPPGR